MRALAHLVYKVFTREEEILLSQPVYWQNILYEKAQEVFSEFVYSHYPLNALIPWYIITCVLHWEFFPRLAISSMKSKRVEDVLYFE